jgi:hypothetical protein
MKDFLLFRRMVTPYIIMVLFWLGVALLIGGMVIASITLLATEDNRDGSGIAALCVMWPIGLPLGILAIRIYCELLILFFRMNETLTEIKNGLSRDQNLPPEV